MQFYQFYEEWPQSNFYTQVLIFILLLFLYQETFFDSFLLLYKWSNRIIERSIFCFFVNWKQNNWARFLLKTKFAYNNFKNASMCHTSFAQVSFENEYNIYSRFFLANKLTMKLIELINIYYQNLYYLL